MNKLRIPTFQQNQRVVDSSGCFTPAALRSFNDAFQAVTAAVNAIAAIPGIAAQLESVGASLDTLDQTVAQAQQVIDQVGQAGASASREAALQGSYIDPSSVLTATPAAITVAPHTRRYTDGTFVSVNGATLPATAQGDTDYVSYSDPDRTGGAVSYQVATTPPVQTGDTHVVGAVMIPATGTVGGGEGPQRPGFVRPNNVSQE